MKNLFLIISISIILISCGQSQNKESFEKNGIKIRFTTTQLGEMSNDKFELINDMKLKGVFLFIPDKKSIVLRHDNGNDELLTIISTKKTKEGNYVMECNKERVLMISPNEHKIIYSIVSNTSMFVFPIEETDINKLKDILTKFK